LDSESETTTASEDGERSGKINSLVALLGLSHGQDDAAEMDRAGNDKGNGNGTKIFTVGDELDSTEVSTEQPVFDESAWNSPSSGNNGHLRHA
jgi:hypothetical protein